jgi:hypothetical protein
VDDFGAAITAVLTDSCSLDEIAYSPPRQLIMR